MKYPEINQTQKLACGSNSTVIKTLIPVKDKGKLRFKDMKSHQTLNKKWQNFKHSAKSNLKNMGKYLLRSAERYQMRNASLLNQKKCSLQFVQVKDIEVKLYKCLNFDVLRIYLSFRLLKSKSIWTSHVQKYKANIKVKQNRK